MKLGRLLFYFSFFFSSRRRHTRWNCDWSSDVCSSDLLAPQTDNYFRGPGGEILDAFAFAKFDIGDMPVNIKAGRHTVFWGEAMLSPVHKIGRASCRERV